MQLGSTSTPNGSARLLTIQGTELSHSRQPTELHARRFFSFFRKLLKTNEGILPVFPIISDVPSGGHYPMTGFIGKVGERLLI